MATLDVRPMMAEGAEPFTEIMRVVEGLRPGEELELLAPLEPVPLYQVLGARGFEHDTRDLGGGDFRVVFRRSGAPLVGEAEELAVYSTEGFGRRILFDGERMRAVLVALEPGQQIPIHAPRVDLVVSVLAGAGRVVGGDRARWVRAGDVAVIPAGAARGLRAGGERLVALHVVSPPPTAADHAHDGHAAWPEPEPGPDVAAIIRNEHRGLREEVRGLGELAAALPEMDAGEARARLDAAIRFLRDDLLSHARAEERSVYPAVERALGAAGATRTMAMDHRRIAEMVGLLEAEAADPATTAPVLHGLHALVTVHLDKEEEVYLPLLDRLSPEERRALHARLTGGH